MMDNVCDHYAWVVLKDDMKRGEKVGEVSWERKEGVDASRIGTTGGSSYS